MQRARKVAGDPSAYMYAARGCGVEGRGKAALKVCGGHCAQDAKLHYCSKDCQRMVRVRMGKYTHYVAHLSDRTGRGIEWPANTDTIQHLLPETTPSTTLRILSATPGRLADAGPVVQSANRPRIEEDQVIWAKFLSERFPRCSASRESSFPRIRCCRWSFGGCATYCRRNLRRHSHSRRGGWRQEGPAPSS